MTDGNEAVSCVVIGQLRSPFAQNRQRSERTKREEYGLLFVSVNEQLEENPRQQKFRAMNGAHLASPIRGELGYAHWPQLGTQFIALLGTKFGAH